MNLVPRNENEAVEMVRSAVAGATPLAISGGNTRSGFGNPAKGGRGISSRDLSGIVNYTPAELTMTVKAGTSVNEVEATLEASSQMLAFEPMDHRGAMGTTGIPTMGGVFAANVSGPRRYVVGAARDSLLGIRFVNGKSELIRAGGRVMKNVTGLDLVKLIAGSHGTLGFLTEVTFRVLPVPQTQDTIAISGLSAADAVMAMASAMALSLEVSGAAHLPPSVSGVFLDGRMQEGGATLLRLEGRSASVSARARNLVAKMAAFGPVSRLGEEDSKIVWRQVRDVHPYCDGTQKPLWRISMAPSVGHRLVAAMALECKIDAFYDWQGGLIWMRMEDGAEPERLRRHIKVLGGGHATLMRASDVIRAGTPAFEPQSNAINLLSARVKHKLDPAGIFNPGKMG